jgi:PAS domain S-box-containing protein
MKIRTKLWLVLASVLLLMAAHWVIFWHFLPDSKTDVAQWEATTLFVLTGITMAGILAAGVLLTRSVLKPLEQLSSDFNGAEAGNRQSHQHLQLPGEFQVLAETFNRLQNDLQAAIKARDELGKNLQDHIRKLENEITTRRAIETELQSDKKYLKIILDSVREGVLMTNTEGRVLGLNPVAEQLTGWKTSEAIGHPLNNVFCVFDEKTRQPMPVPVDTVIAEGRSMELAGRTVLTDRSEINHPIALNCAPIRDSDGIVLGAILIFRDVTRQRQAEAQILKLNQELEQRVACRTTELCESERRHRTLLANLQGMVYRCRNERQRPMEFVSDGCHNLLGVESADLMSGRTIYSDLIHPDDGEQVWNDMQAAVARRSVYTLEYRVKHANGQWRHVLEQGRAVFDSQEQVTALEGYIADITRLVDTERERRVLEEELVRSQKLEAIGTLAGGIAHDFNNVLAAILGSAELIRMDLAQDHPSREFLDQIFTVGNRAREVVQQILTFSRQRENERHVIYLQPVVKECIKLLRSTTPPMVSIACQVDPDCAPVLANSTQIYQVIMNLCMNAWQAMPESHGDIKVNLGMCDIDEKVCRGHSGLTPGRAVQLSISDNGCGMDKATLARIFDPLFTTKPTGKGSGLGLSVVRDIVKAHKGIITVESEPGKGTDFHLFFTPQTTSEEEAPTQSNIIFSTKHEHIMFVDDDEYAGLATEKLLDRLGYQVQRFQHPEEALERFQGNPAEFDLVITDLAMRGMTGDNLAAALLQIRPNIPILITTGVVDSPILKKAGELGVSNVLLKPVSTETLAREIAHHLAGRTKSDVTVPA